MPGGLAAGAPTVSVAPTFIALVAGGVAEEINGETGSDSPMCNVIEPPLLPVNSTSGPFTILMTVPEGASTSNMAGK